MQRRSTNAYFNNMIGNYMIITLCGSTKFMDEFIGKQKRLTLEGNIGSSTQCEIEYIKKINKLEK
jgi:hypothetical protein